MKMQSLQTVNFMILWHLSFKQQQGNIMKKQRMPVFQAALSAEDISKLKAIS